MNKKQTNYVKNCLDLGTKNCCVCGNHRRIEEIERINKEKYFKFGRDGKENRVIELLADIEQV